MNVRASASPIIFNRLKGTFVKIGSEADVFCSYIVRSIRFLKLWVRSKALRESQEFVVRLAIISVISRSSLLDFLWCLYCFRLSNLI